MDSRNRLAMILAFTLLISPLSLQGQQQPITIPAGTRLRIKFDTAVGTAISRVNDGVTVELLKPVDQAGQALLPAGVFLTGRVLAVRKGDKHRKVYPMIRLGFIQLRLPDGRTFPLQASLADLGVSEYVDSEGAASTVPVTKGDQVAVAAASGGIGAGVGGIAGGGKGAAVGAGVGTAVGILADLAARSAQWEDFKLKEGRKAWLRLDADLEISAAGPK